MPPFDKSKEGQQNIISNLKGETKNVRCQIFEMSDFCMAYPEMNGGVLRYYIYIIYIINIIYNIFYFSFSLSHMVNRKSDILLI
jgi:hypothetical protein